ncbi:hypothetical protein J4573_16270 [Actinomadura barringtoniae]|uniref:Uncharacterized protein n=1 Tax=Actinomadura barringtoniae TaxID=1427535 RepID=A0A939T3V7_9ACTN|nr:hypothetical protein [Actinomadura barringtoniae]MBO2448658.1 hypothetical protein [Actinomadura barringtoniae]
MSQNSPLHSAVVFSVLLPALALAAACEDSNTGRTPPSVSPAPPSSPGPSEQPAAGQPTPPQPTAKPQSYRGHGDRVLRIKDGGEIWLAAITHSGSSNFIVDTVQPGGEDGEGLVNAIGRYKGTMLFNIEQGSTTQALKIKADGAWTVKLKPLAEARRWAATKVTGKGDDVLALDPPSSGLATAKLRHTGESNFIVDAYTRDGDTENMVNEIGAYDGEVQLPEGAFLFTVHADGRWTMTK